MQASLLASLQRYLWRLLEAHKIDADSLFRRNGLDPSLVHESRGRYPYDLVWDAWRESAAITQNPHIGLEASKYYSPLDLNALGVTFLSSATLIEALQRLVRYEAVLSSNMDNAVVVKEDRLNFIYATPLTREVDRRIIEDSRMAILLDLCRMGLEQRLDPIEVAFTYPEPEDLGEHFGMFRCPLLFSEEVSRICFKLTDAHRPFTDACRELARSNDQILDSMIKDLNSSDLVSQVKRAIIHKLPSGAPDQSEVAKLIAVSNRTLQRRLADEGTSFRTLLTEVRRELAQKYISDYSMPLAEISYMLGFADTSSFSRAFKQWTGDSPKVFRANSSQ